ncbi:MAG: hypothetical protein J0J06_14025 [Sphingomonas sp.]|uniref:hypothetical protein n=1 Tax=Sphingomonas sp. TaxID=28214 RepID=UPI001AC19982|nr:hypothetical protein [Sphingomonas sp.]MBN8816550.1 hypothetical protein [Sphingomonas sp.]
MAKPVDCFRGHAAVGRGQLPLDQQDFLFEVGAARALRGQAGGEVGIARTDDALLDKIEHVLDRAFDPRALCTKCLEMRLPFAHGGRAIVEKIGK